MRQIEKISRLLERLLRLEAGRKADARKVSGVTCLRAFLAGEPDPYAHLGPPEESPVRSLRWHLFWKGDDDGQDIEPIDLPA
jgi:hypothetical protein